MKRRSHNNRSTGVGIALAGGLALWAMAASAQTVATPPIKSTDPKMMAAIEDLVAANRILSHAGILPGYGHVSMRSPLDPNRILISRSLAPGQVTAEDIVELNIDCTPVIPGGPLLYQERFIHCAIYKARPDVGGVVHSHTPYMIAFSVSKRPLRPVVNTGRALGFEGPPVHDVSKIAGVTNNLIASPEAGRSLAETLGKNSVVLMRGHGSTVVASSVREVVTTAINVEMSAMILTQALALGGPITYLNPKDYGNERLQREIGAEARGWNALKQEMTGK
jgi:ribulose-5-phosphate 4-epimerase/fuculose-1-phosphate aldolase